MYYGIGKAALVYHFSFGHYHHEENVARVNWIFDANNALRDITEAHCCAQTKSFRNSKYYHMRGMLTVYFSIDMKSEDRTYFSVVYNFGRQKFLKDRCSVVMPDRRNQCHTEEFLKDVDVMRCSANSPRMSYVSWRYAKATSPAWLIRLTYIAKRFTAYVRHKATFTEAM